MVMAPLGDILMKSMQLDTKQFAAAVSAYAFSAGASGLLAAGFAACEPEFENEVNMGNSSYPHKQGFSKQNS